MILAKVIGGMEGRGGGTIMDKKHGEQREQKGTITHRILRNYSYEHKKDTYMSGGLASTSALGEP